MSVKEAAERLAVGRPALSNFLNGKSALSTEMAIRLERAFRADRQELLAMQAAYSQQVVLGEERTVAVRPFVPAFLTIKASDIEGWADNNIEARSLLAVLLRKLVHSTGNELQRVDFPGYDNAQRNGPDGVVEAGAATPWLPEGKSYWEFGTSKRPGEKANRDYSARLKSTDPDERSASAFVFVTPRNWSGKNAWEEEKNRAGEWKIVRALDASDLEQWLEQSVAGQVWFAEQLGLPDKGYETLEQAWHRWASATEPQLTHELFAPAVAAYRSAFIEWIERPSEKPFVIAADSRDEALAFLACLFEDDELRQHQDRVAIFTSSAVLRTLVASSVSFIPIVHSIDTERELADARGRLHCIAFRPRNAVDIKPDVALDILGGAAFEAALASMGIQRSEVDRLARESGRSPTILRRRLSRNAAIRTPAWASDEHTARSLAPMALIGSWHVGLEADREIVSRVAGRDYESVEDDLTSLLRLDDSPVWSAGRNRGVASKVDALFAIAARMTQACLDRFFEVAQCVLSEVDPALELPADERWAAALYDKERANSDALREGISETLVILAVHGNNLFQGRLGIDVEGRVGALVRELLEPLTLERLLSYDHALPWLAEAAPDDFVGILEEDLRGNHPVVLGLLKPAEGGSLFASPSRTGLLWALECLAWKPERLLRVVMVLARLSEPTIDDNWANKPEASLQAVFRCWMPQTAATVDERVKALGLLVGRFPRVGWEICIAQIRPGPQMGHNSYRPRWRSDASGFGHIVAEEERRSFRQQAVDSMIGWSSHDENTLGDLVVCLRTMSDENQARVWDLIDEWSRGASDAAKAALRERIRRFAFARRGRHSEPCDAIRDHAREVYEGLQPNDSVVRHSWLFADYWVQESADEIEDEDFNHTKRCERIEIQRRDAMAEVWGECGFEGVVALLRGGSAGGVVGQYAAHCTTDNQGRVAFARRCLSIDGELQGAAEQCLRGFAATLDEEVCVDVLRTASEGLSIPECTRLLVSAPFRASTWRLLDEYDVGIRDAYWGSVVPAWGRRTAAELTELVDRLLEARRPRAALHAVGMDFEDVETSRLRQLLHDVATIGDEPAGHLMPSQYVISDALDSLDSRPGVTSDEMAQLELFFIDALDRSSHGVPNLEAQIARSPEMYVQAIALAYKRSDGGVDPPEWTIEDPEQRAMAARMSYRLLNRIEAIPGADEQGRIDAVTLTAWLARVRRLCDDCVRAAVGDLCLGQLLSRSPTSTDGTWPCEAVCEAMEEVASVDIGRGLCTGVYNSRGVHWQGEGGEEEREIAAKYRAWAERLRFDYPYVGGVLEEIAKTYDREAARQDSEAEVNKRLRC